MAKYICIHGHFYQPPRENPWLEAVEGEDSAYPFHDWNEGISSECYGPNASSRILDSHGKIIDIVNNYIRMSFDFGPTLLSWLEKARPEIYRAILAADRLSKDRFSGHGAALAQVYNHIIMPLASSRDKRTQVHWGIRDFIHRFSRFPEGMWLAETAVDLESLDIMAEAGIRFTVLAPHQAGCMRRIGEKSWIDTNGTKIDPKKPYLCRLPSGRSIAIFFYDGPVSREIGFGDLLKSGDVFADRLTGLFTHGREDELVHVATDGETYGHHRRFGDMALAYCLRKIEQQGLATITVYGEYLEKHPPLHEVQIIENTSWSCVHGVERWRENCGCQTGTHPDWQQHWRKPLRESLDILRNRLADFYQKEISAFVKDPWKTRDEYIDVVLDRSKENVRSFFGRMGKRQFNEEETQQALKFLEMQRYAMFMFTSCGWFFDDVSGIESIQNLKFAARALQLVDEDVRYGMEKDFIDGISRVTSNLPDMENGKRIWEEQVIPSVIDLLRVGAHYAVYSLFEETERNGKIYCYNVKNLEHKKIEKGRESLVVGRVHILSEITWEKETVCYAGLHFGGHNLLGGVHGFRSHNSSASLEGDIESAFQKADISQAIRILDEHFGTHSYSLWHLFRDEQREVLNRILFATLSSIEGTYRQIFEDNYSLMLIMKELKVPFPKALATTAEFILNRDLLESLKDDEIDSDKLAWILEEIQKWSFQLDRVTSGYEASRKVERLVQKVIQNPTHTELVHNVEKYLGLLVLLPLQLDLWRSQNIFFNSRAVFQKIMEREKGGDTHFRSLSKHYQRIAELLHIRLLNE